jgi:hypothetical protein
MTEDLAGSYRVGETGNKSESTYDEVERQCLNSDRLHW